jgi:hypothetical protein
MSDTRVFQDRTKSRLQDEERTRWLRGKEGRSTEMGCKHGIAATLEAGLQTVVQKSHEIILKETSQGETCEIWSARDGRESAEIGCWRETPTRWRR